jgi:hypothetical protein
LYQQWKETQMIRSLTTGLLLLALTACGAAAPAADDSTGAAPAASPAASAPAASEPVASPSTSAGLNGDLSGGSAAPTDEVTTQAAAFLATQLNTAAADLQLQSREEVEWNDSSLGCPAPDMMYMQVITPGFKLTYSDGTQTYELHTDADGSNVVWCDNGTPKQIGQP